MRANAYACALNDVDSLFTDHAIEVATEMMDVLEEHAPFRDYAEEVTLHALVARGLFPTEEERRKVAAALELPVEYLFPKVPHEMDADPQLQRIRSERDGVDPESKDPETPEAKTE